MTILSNVFLTLTVLIWEAVAEFCDNEEKTFCDAPSRCCMYQRGCCYDSTVPSQHFRLQVWNMWYFWFLIILIMMTCMSACLWYRRRLRLGRTPGQSHYLRNSGRLPHRMTCFTFWPVQVSESQQQDPAEVQLSLPPDYSEVVNRPGLYPLSNKPDLPPYPGHAKPEWQLPPPYSEFGEVQPLQSDAGPSLESSLTSTQTAPMPGASGQELPQSTCQRSGQHTDQHSDSEQVPTPKQNDLA